MTNETTLTQRLCNESAEFSRLYEETKANAMRPAADTPRVLACGLLKAGKSALLNALTGNLTQEYFATKASRATTKIAELTVNCVTYVDTPGVDACAADDQEAWTGIQTADVFLFVHNSRIGALDVAEATFLQELQRRRRNLNQHFLVALTHLETTDTDIETRATDLGQSMQKVLGFSPTIVPTSFTRYHKGMLENKPTMVATSGMSQLQEQLRKTLSQTDWCTTRTTQKTHQQNQMQTLLTQAIAQRQKEVTDLQQAQAKLFKHLHQDLNGFVASLRQRLALYEQI